MDYVPGGHIQESHMVYNAYLFVLMIHVSNFGTGWGREMVLSFSARCSVWSLPMG
jgi:hypothetical protein